MQGLDCRLFASASSVQLRAQTSLEWCSGRFWLGQGFGTDFDELFLSKQSELEETLSWKFDSKHKV